MTTPRPTLASLRRDRDQALARSVEGLRCAGRRMGELDNQLAAFAGDHPALALGGAVVAGGAAGLIAPPPMMKRIGQLARVVFVGPMIDDALRQVSWVFNGNAPDQAPPPASEGDPTT